MKKLFLLSLMAMLLPLSMWAQDELTVTVLGGEEETSVFKYNGTNTLKDLNYKVTVTETGDEVEDFYVTITDSKSVKYETTDKVGVGSYTVTIRSKEEETLGYTGTATFEVKAKEVNPAIITAKEGVEKVTAKYGEKINLEAFIEVDAQLLADGDKEMEKADFLSGLQIVQMDGEPLTATPEVGEYSVSVDGIKVGNPSNYVYTRPRYGVTVELIITKNPLLVVANGKVYNGQAVNTKIMSDNKSYKVYYFDEDAEGQKGDEVSEELFSTLKLNFTYSKDDNEGVESAINVGDYTFRATITESEEDVKHYDIANDGKVSYTITPAELTIKVKETPELSKIYGKKDPDLTEQFTYTYPYSSSQTNEVTAADVKKLGLTMVREKGEDVKYTEKGVLDGYVISPADGVDLQNFTIVYDTKKPAKFTINPKPIGQPKETAEGQLDKEIKLTPATDRADLLTYKGEAFTVDADYVKNLFTLEYTGVVKEASEEGAVAEMSLDKDYTIALTPKDVAKAINADDEFTITIFGKGNYCGDMKDNYAWSTGYKIAKAKLDIKKDESQRFWKTTAEATPVLTDLFEYNKLQGEDKAEEVVKFKMSGTTNAVGTHYINLVPADQQPAKYNNYEITYSGASFEIKDGNLVFDALNDEDIAERINAYDGGLVNVTIKNLQNVYGNKIEAEKWYTLALPFDIYVKDLSRLFTYAIVNVPNTSKNEGAGRAYFRLTMQKVPANTLMAFKVAEDMTWDEAYELTFNGVTINAEVPEMKDVAGNEFLCVYTKKHIEAAEDWFMAEDGLFYPASVMVDYSGGVDIYPLNGYVHFAETVDPATARIFMEDADGSVTAISAVKTDKVNVAEGWYTVGGMKLNAEPTQKGVYINNGKKVVIK